MTSGYPEVHPTDHDYYQDPYGPEDEVPDPEYSEDEDRSGLINSSLRFREYLDVGRDVEIIESAFIQGEIEGKEIEEDYSGLSS